MPKAPKCKICGQPFWGICSHPGYLVTTPVTRPPRVTAKVTEALPVGNASQERLALVALQEEVAMCHDEIARLKRLLSEASVGRVAMTPAEKQKAYRERQRA